MPSCEVLERVAPVDPDASVEAVFKAAMRKVPSAVTIVTSRDDEGQSHGMAASAVISVSMSPPTLLVAINRGAGLNPVAKATKRLCVNFLSQEQQQLLTPFSRSDLKHQRFESDGWQDVQGDHESRLPWHAQASAVAFAEVETAIEHATHTLFLARVVDVAMPIGNDPQRLPMVWLAGQCVSISPP
jgi:flavin reductase (DIM6/NTAB) family NADH-FMN oxidoreductase RutF